MNPTGHDDGMTLPERIDDLERALALARRDINVASLEYLAVISAGNVANYTDARARLVSLGIAIDTTVEKLELLRDEQRDARESR
jgi:hypothetical protein